MRYEEKKDVGSKLDKFFFLKIEGGRLVDTSGHHA